MGVKLVNSVYIIYLSHGEPAHLLSVKLEMPKYGV